MDRPKYLIITAPSFISERLIEFQSIHANGYQLCSLHGDLSSNTGIFKIWPSGSGHVASRLVLLVRVRVRGLRKVTPDLREWHFL